jgi:predicted nucleotide-binding protein
MAMRPESGPINWPRVDGGYRVLDWEAVETGLDQVRQRQGGRPAGPGLGTGTRDPGPEHDGPGDGGDITVRDMRNPVSTRRTRSPWTSPPRIFIGHGRSSEWRDLKDHLTDKHSYQVVAYEVGARAGHTIRDILDEMLTESSFALLVMTAEDETGDGQVRARQNVVHELGLFQGRLGFARAIVLAERGVELFSNIDGVQQLRFTKGSISETYGDILATLYREFRDLR